MSDIDEKLDNTLNSMKSQINEEKLSDDFKEKLCKKLEESEEKTSNKSKMHFPKSLIAVAACFVFVMISGSLAMEIDNVILKHFSNIDKVAKRAVDEGKVEYLNQKYVTDQGISIKADYMFQEDGDLYIVLEAKIDNNYKIYMNEYEVLDDNNTYLYSRGRNGNVISTNLYYSFENDTIIYIKIRKIEESSNINYKNINHIYVKSFQIEDDIEEKIIDGNWKIKLK